MMWHQHDTHRSAIYKHTMYVYRTLSTCTHVRTRIAVCNRIHTHTHLHNRTPARPPPTRPPAHPPSCPHARTAPHGTARHRTARHGIARHRTAPHRAASRLTAPHRATPQRTAKQRQRTAAQRNQRTPAARTHTHTCMHACVYMHATCIHAYIHTCIRAYMHTCIHALYIYIHIYTYIYTYIYIRYLFIYTHGIYKHKYICICIHIHIGIYMYIYIYIELYIAQCTIYVCTIIYGLHARLGQRSGNDGCCSTLIPELASAGVSMEGLPDAVPNSSSPSFSEHKQSVKETELHKTDAISFEKNPCGAQFSNDRVMSKHDDVIALNPPSTAPVCCAGFVKQDKEHKKCDETGSFNNIAGKCSSLLCLPMSFQVGVEALEMLPNRYQNCYYSVTKAAIEDFNSPTPPRLRGRPNSRMTSSGVNCPSWHRGMTEADVLIGYAHVSLHLHLFKQVCCLHKAYLCHRTVLLCMSSSFALACACRFKT